MDQLAKIICSDKTLEEKINEVDKLIIMILTILIGLF